MTNQVEMAESVIMGNGGIDNGTARIYPKIGLLIDGEWIFDRPACHQVLNPSDGGVLGPVPGATEQDLDRALAASALGFGEWRRVPLAERAAVVRRTAAILRGRIEQIAPVITLEQGKPLPDARNEVLRAASFLDWDAEQLLRSYGRIVPSDPPVQKFVFKEPIGPVAAFTPWNVPISSPSRKLSGAIAAGCSVIIKPAEETPGASCLFAQCFLDAGLPKKALSVVFGNPSKVSEQLILSPVIRMVTLTGSVPVGKALTRLAAQGMKPVLMELGGHAPVLIDRGVCASAIARSAATAKFRMAGQICASPTRFIVHRESYTEFIEAFAKATDALKVGDGFAGGVDVGPVVSERRLEAISSLVDDAVQRGATLSAGGRRIGNRGYFYAPTVLSDVPLDARVMIEEPFGPIAACVAVADMDEGLALANSLTMGLSGYLFTNAIERIAHLSRELECGVVSVNSFAVTGPEAPFGGYKESGVGREGGEESLDSYMVAKTVLQRNEAV